MKIHLLPSVTLAALALGFALPSGAFAKDAELIREHVVANSNAGSEPESVDVEPIRNEALGEVFAAPVYKVIANYGGGAKGISFAAVHDDQVVKISNNRAHAGQDTMSAILAEDFRIAG